MGIYPGVLWPVSAMGRGAEMPIGDNQRFVPASGKDGISPYLNCRGAFFPQLNTKTTGTAEGIRLAGTLPNGRYTIRGYVAANCDGATSGRGLWRLPSTTKADRQRNASPAGRGLFASTSATISTKTPAVLHRRPGQVSKL